jgi:hypothetical protein
MAETNISANKITGQVIEADHVNELKAALVTTLSGRDSTGTLASNQNLGSATYPWGIGYINSIISNGSLVDFSALTSESNSIKSGQTRSTSDLSDFIRASGSGASATIQAAATSLVCTINAAAVTATADIALSSLTTASAGATEECSINDTSLVDQVSSKYIGGESDVITIDAVGASISAKIGQVICLRAPAGELMLAYVKSATELSNVKRGYFLNSSGLPIVRETLANNDTLSLMSLGFVFLENDGATVEVSYLNPVYSFETPGSPSTGQYWFDLQVKQWKRYNGSDFVVINRIPIGIVIIDATDCIGSRSSDFNLAYKDGNTFSFGQFDSTSITSRRVDNSISINSKDFEIQTKAIFNITTDLVSGVSEAADTDYYCYLTQDGARQIDSERPYDTDPFKLGFYHPYNSWRCIATFHNNASSDIDSVKNINKSFTDPDIDSESYMIVEDQKSSGTNGGSPSAGVRNTRTLNTVEENTIFGASLATNQITLPAGKYFITAKSIGSYTSHKLFFRNVTDSTDALIGTNGNGDSASGYNTFSLAEGVLTLTSTKVFQIEHYFQGSGGSVMGYANSQGTEIYSRVIIKKI